MQKTRESEIYAAVHEGFMKARIALHKTLSSRDRDTADDLLSVIMTSTCDAAVQAYRRPLRARKAK